MKQCINEKLSQIVLEHLNNGYQINASTMNGTQGELARIDLRKGTELRRVWVQKYSEGFFEEGTKLTVGIHKDPAPALDDTSTLWLDDFTPCSEIKWKN